MDILLSFYKELLSLFLPLILIGSAMFGILYIIFFGQYREYKNSAYYKITGHKYFSVRYNSGRYGEYLTYKYLKDHENHGAKFLFNVYIPKENGETSEIDVLMLSPKGIFVFESKNYSGWIFGSESQKNWYQTLPTGRGKSHKEHFYNPIMQNRSHIKHLKAFIGEQFAVRSIIVFSERCTLKSLSLSSNDISVIKRNEVLRTVNSICTGTPDTVLSANDIDTLFAKLYPLTQVDETIKLQHISNINSKSISHSEQPHIAQTEEIPQNADAKTPEQPHKTNNEDVCDHLEQTVMKCPKCGGDLIVRTSTRGANAGKQFYGCSNFPKCRYTQNI